MAKDFIHLHVHTQYSINNGLGSIRDYVDKAISDGMRGMAITDSGNMFGIKEFHDYVNRVNKRREKNGEEPFKPILGCEMRVEPDYHIVLLAKNYQGYKNLVKLVSRSWTDRAYEIPCTNRDDLDRYHEGLIILSGCLSGEVPAKFLCGDISGSREAIEWYHRVFGNDYYLELERHEVKDASVDANREIFVNQEKANRFLLEQAQEYGIKVVCTNNVHFVEQDYAEAHDRLLCIATKKKLESRKRIKYSKQEWFKTIDEMNALFVDIPDALSNTIEVLDKVEIYSIDHESILPVFPIPVEFESEFEYLKEKTLGKAYQIYGEQLPSEVEERLGFEFDIIKAKGYSRYLLIIQDLINVMIYDYGVTVGPGRGSVAGSLVCYCLGITAIDPLKYDLLFERFASLSRNMLVDIDIDFDEEGRYLAEKYLIDKYGNENCAHIVTFDKMDPKTTMKSVAKLEKVPNAVINGILKAIPNNYPHWRYNVKNLCLDIPEFQKAESSKDPALSNTIKYSKILDGKVSGTGVHACGLIVSQGPVSNWAPVFSIKDPDEKREKIACTQYDGWDIEDTGLVKFDLLELETLTEIKIALSMIKQNHGIDVNLDEIPIDDQKTLELFHQGRTNGVFEFEYRFIRPFLRRIHHLDFDDLVALYVLFRPGIDHYLSTYIVSKNGWREIEYDIPCMEKYLKTTYGLTLYQEQLMHLSRQIASFTREESDTLRKAMGKKKQEIIDSLKPKFIEGGVKNGYKPRILKKIWKDWEKYGSYLYCKSHAVCYTWLAYQTAYLKTHYPVEYMSALLMCRKNDRYEIRKLVRECKRMGIQPIQ